MRALPIQKLLCKSLLKNSPFKSLYVFDYIPLYNKVNTEHLRYYFFLLANDTEVSAFDIPSPANFQLGGTYRQLGAA